MRVTGKRIRRQTRYSVERLEERQLLSNTLTVGPGQTYSTIQSAVNAASPGDTVLVYPGTYTEQVTIPSTLTGLNLVASSQPIAPTSVNVPAGASVAQVNALFPANPNAPTIVAPAGAGTIIDDKASNVTIRGFNVEGPGNLYAGIYVEGGATSVQISYNQILHIHNQPPDGSLMYGFGIAVAGGASATIDENFVSDYQEAGIRVGGAGSSTVTNNVVVGMTNFPQSGIDFEDGTSGSISSNLVTGNTTLPYGGDAGILIHTFGVSVSYNTCYNNDYDIEMNGSVGTGIFANNVYGASVGISLFDTGSLLTVANNNVHDNSGAGLAIDYGSYAILVTNNSFSNNGTDIVDQSGGPLKHLNGDASTADFYRGNSFTTTNPAGLLAQSVQMFSFSSAPAAGSQNVFDPQIATAGGVDLGTKFTSDVSGTISAVRFYKGSADTGVHQGELWSSTGTLLASIGFSNETASGWQQANFSTPVQISANTTYIIAYHTTSGFISYTAGGLSNSIDAAPLHAPASSTSNGNGVYHYGNAPGDPFDGQFPDQSNGQSPNYWVDAVFAPGSQTTYTIFAPSPNYIWAPAYFDQNAFDPEIVVAGGVELGMQFHSSVAGLVDGVRFYKSSNDTGVHTGQLWSSTGQLLASVTFTGESASGWQQANFSSPVQINANTTYIIAYHSTSGFLSYSPGEMNPGFANGPLSTDSVNQTYVNNDLFAYDATPGTPAYPSTYDGASPNYWVDVIFRTNAAPPPVAPPATDSLFSPSAVPASSDQNVIDPQIASSGGVDLGTKFTASETGVVSGVQFFKGSQDTGVDVGELWSGDGVLLATATFTAESSSGWQQVKFSTPITLTANTTYIIAYHTTSDSIAYTPGGMSSAISNGPLTALASSTTTGGSTGNGVYNYDSAPGTPRFPNTFNGQSPNYWVDLSFIPT